VVSERFDCSAPDGQILAGGIVLGDIRLRLVAQSLIGSPLACDRLLSGYFGPTRRFLAFATNASGLLRPFSSA
jgi:hypothetical protein